MKKILIVVLFLQSFALMAFPYPNTRLELLQKYAEEKTQLCITTSHDEEIIYGVNSDKKRIDKIDFSGYIGFCGEDYIPYN